MSTLPVSSFDDDTPSDLLGPFRFLVKASLLDCSTKSKCCSVFTCLLGVVMVVVTLIRISFLMEAVGAPLELGWGEGIFFGYPGLTGFVFSLCLFGWTKNGLIPKFCKRLVRVRMLRQAANSKLDKFRILHGLALGFSIPWFVAMMSWIIYNFVHGKVYYGGPEQSIAKRIFLIISNFYVWFISTVCLAIYIFISAALNREVSYFNEELKKAKEEKTLRNIGVLEKFDFRQNQILEMILFAHESLSSLGGFVPLFMYWGLANGVYLTSFVYDVPLLYAIIVGFNLASIIFYNVFVMFPAIILQEHLKTTTRILINNDEFECSKDPIVYQTYRIMIDRFQKVNTNISIIASLPITVQTFAACSFVAPNLGFLLIMVKNVILVNGGHV
ncbi:Serpentine Receptor, class R [Caenorhabditis elegans]|uniref:Serpentine Receptor, class R n=1 Tax=Caenorhabditis elegans TaxID=6239 RepID=O16244_CAEEL|nr:Serpentine Receptor, class R [Caenorhabditis elegans]CCD64389.2 Serpentine Receptor, class R [Caenorhabditis elegans]|eukprot:NP_001309480.1 Serpentine Receptor, class R [Caenorhabditis elegans]